MPKFKTSNETYWVIFKQCNLCYVIKNEFEKFDLNK